MSNDIGGVWRTVGGRRIFIKDGQSLDEAMKDSGKFGNKENRTEIKEYKEEKDFISENENLLYDNQIKGIDNEANDLAIREYTGNTGIGSYDNINKYLNGQIELQGMQKQEIDNKINLIDESIKEKTKNDMYVYRGIAIKEDSIDVGDEIINKGFTSTSIDKNVAWEFANHYHGSLIQIEVPKGTEALYIGGHSGSGYNEGELLFKMNSKIIITKKDEKGIYGKLIYE